MVTRKFQAVFDHARICNPQVELSAKVTTDHTHHYVRLRMGREDTSTVQSLWIDNCRTYTTEQEAHVRQLFTYHEPLVREAFDKWLVAHNFPTLAMLPNSGQEISARMGADGEVESCTWAKE